MFENRDVTWLLDIHWKNWGHHIEVARRNSSLSKAPTEQSRNSTAWPTFWFALQSPPPKEALVWEMSAIILSSASILLALPKKVSGKLTCSCTILESCSSRRFSGCCDTRNWRICRWNSSQAATTSAILEPCDDLLYRKPQCTQWWEYYVQGGHWVDIIDHWSMIDLFA